MQVERQGASVRITLDEREVALLIRDRKNGQLLYEARASNAGPSASIDYLLPAMFEAASVNEWKPSERMLIAPLA